MAEARRLALKAGLLALVLVVGGPVVAQPILGRGPSWNELSAGEREILAPLAGEWDRMDAQRKAKWIGIARRYPTMPSIQQDRLRAQMKSWATLSPDERREARERYRAQKQLPESRRQDIQKKWQEYRDLPEDQRRSMSNPPPPASTQNQNSPGRPKKPEPDRK